MFLNTPSWILPFSYDETRQDTPPSFGRDSQVNSEHPAQNKRMCVSVIYKERLGKQDERPW